MFLKMVSGKNSTGNNSTGNNSTGYNGTFSILGSGVGLGVWNEGFRFGNLSLGKFDTSAPSFPTFTFVPLLPVLLLPVPLLLVQFLPKIFKNRVATLLLTRIEAETYL